LPLADLLAVLDDLARAEPELITSGEYPHGPLETSTGRHPMKETLVILVGGSTAEHQAERNIEQFNFHVVQHCSE